MGGYINLGNWRKRVWYPALQRAGVAPRPPSQMRHSFATLGLAAGAPIEWISKHMGHSDIRTTLRYYARFLPRRTPATSTSWMPMQIARSADVSRMCHGHQSRGYHEAIDMP